MTTLQTCRRHPGPRFLRTCPGCAQELYDTEAANRAKATFTALLASVELPGPVQSMTIVGTGAVIVCATPDSEWGAFEVMSWRHRTDVETSKDAAEWPAGEQVPQITYVTTQSVWCAEEIGDAVAWATTQLTESLAAILTAA